MKKIVFLFAVLIPFFVSCDMFSPKANNPSDLERVSGISFGSEHLTVNIGTAEYLPLSIYPADVQNKVVPNFEYDSEAISIDADSYGIVIQGLKPQNTYIRATINGRSAICIIDVTNSEGIYVGDQYIYSNSSGVVEIQPNGVQNISVSLMGGSAADQSLFTWTSSNTSVANITSAMNNCVVRSFATGTAQISVMHPAVKWPYTFIVHSYTDDYQSTFLTTDSNIITINKTEFASKNVSVSLKNSYQTGDPSYYKWEIDSDGEPPCISVQANGDSAIITALSSGMNRIKVSHDYCEYPLFILVRVTTSIANVYVTTSVSTLEITGSSIARTVTADIAGFDGFYDKSKFVWTLPDDINDYADYSVYENNLSIMGKVNAVFKVKVSHELSDYARSVLVILREQDGSRIDNSIYITTDQNYVQTKIGAATIPITVTLIGGETGDENNFSWTVDGGQNNLFVQFETTHGSVNARSAFGSLAQGTLYISPRNIGSATVTVSHPKSSYSTDITVKVYSEYAQLEEPMYINSPIASLKKLGGTSEQLSVTLSGNFSPSDEDSVSWDSSDPSLVSFMPSTGTEVLMNVAYGQGKKQTYITVSHPKAQSSKRILLLSADTQQDLDSLKAVYADQTYYRTNVNSIVNVSLNAVGLEPHDVIDWSASPNGIVLVDKSASDQLSASVTGISSGLVTVTARIRDVSAAACELSFVVLPEGESTGTISAQFLTTAKNAVLFQEIGDSAEVSVHGVNIAASDLYLTSWSGYDQSIISVAANGSTATLTALNYGQTKITVSHPMSAIDLIIDVKIGALYSWTEELYPYITVESDVVLMVKGDNRVIGASLVNHQTTNGFSFRLNPSTSSIASITGFTNGTCIIDALEAGMSEIVISNIFCNYEREVLLVVANSPEELAGFNYLTTGQNVITVPTNTPVTVTVSVPSIANPPSNSFTWQTSDPTIASVVSSGHFALVTGGQKTGTAIITVRQNDCQFPLEIIVNVIDPKLAANYPYIMSPNLITLRVGDPLSTITAELIGGYPADNVNFTWRTIDTYTIDLYGSNETAQVRAKTVGTTQIFITHPKSNTERSILVICEPQLSYEYSITVSENIVRLSPSDTARSITATLVNGTPADVHGFKWWADSYDIIDFNYTGNTCVITPKSTGSTYIHVSHPKSSYARDILVQISQFSEFKFVMQNVSLAAGTQTFVNLQVPTYNFTARVDYEAVDPITGANASNIVTASGTSAVATINAHAPGNVVLNAKLVNASNGAVQATAQLLVNVTPSSTPSTYINYSGSTIITIEKGATRQISAALMGLNATSTDSNSLQWKTSDWFHANGYTINADRAINISPTPSSSGTVTNNSIQITGLTAGKECTITISHEKANSSIVLYVIVPGINAANVALSTGSAKYVTVGDPIFTVSATITNPQDNDYELLDWKLTQTGDVVNMSGSGKNISVMPKNPGSAIITATVPSSLKSASVEITVEPQNFISIEYANLTTYPGQALLVKYSVSPPDLIDCVTWTVTDERYVKLAHNSVINGVNTNLPERGLVSVHGMNYSGTATITATLHVRNNRNIPLARASMIVKNGWENKLSVSTTYINHPPVKPVTTTATENPFTISYEVNPYVADIKVYIPYNELRLVSGTYNRQEGNYYFIEQDKLKRIDNVTGAGYGIIELEPVGERRQTIEIQAVNRYHVDPVFNELSPQTFPDYPLSVEADIYYSDYTFDIKNFTSTRGRKQYSYIDSSIGAIVIGDFSQVEFTLVPQEQNATPEFGTISFTGNGSEQLQNWAGDNPVFYQRNQIDFTKAADFNSSKKFLLTHKMDYTGSGTPWGFASAQPVEDNNHSQVGFVYAGMIEILYSTPVARNKSFKLLVYVSIRNSPYNL